MENLGAHLNSFASRCFRDVADRDYISARMCYRAGLISQFHWAALQAFEKYYKAILLYNRIKAKNVRHDLSLAQKHAEKAPFKIKLSSSSSKLLAHLDNYGRFRYLETSYFVRGPKLAELDKAVWELRRYCRVINYELRRPGKDPIPMLEMEIKGGAGTPMFPRLNGGLRQRHQTTPVALRITDAYPLRCVDVADVRPLAHAHLAAVTMM